MCFLLSLIFVSNGYSQAFTLQNNNNYFSPAIFNNEKPKFKVSSDGVIDNSGMRYSISASSPIAMPPPSADLDQIRNGAGDAGPGSGTAWVNGNAGASNAHYAEGWSICYRMRMENLSNGTHTLVIEWDTRNSSKSAIDFITHYQNLDEPAGSHQATFGHAQENINPIFGISSLTSVTPTTKAILKPNLPDAAGATFDLLAGKGKEVLTMWGGTISTATYVSQGLYTAANASTSMEIVFTSTAPTVVLAWGGHIASRFDWGIGNSAGAVSGSSYHTRLISFDGSGGNQDRSLSAAAVVVPPPPCPTLTPNPQSACPEAASMIYTYTPETGVSYAWSLTDNTAGATLQGANASGVFTTTGGTVTVIPSGTDFTSGGSFDLSVVMTKTGTANVTCPYDEIGIIKPTPTVNDPADQTKCNGAATDAITFSGAVTGTTFNWTNNTTSIGLAASGSGDIASFNAVNTGTTPVVATITVTPVKDGCTGTAQTFTITVNPTPTVTDPADQTKCNGAATDAITFSGAVTGTTFNWTNNTTSIGLAASGSGNIASFNAVNTGTTPVVATITVTPVKDGCTGTAQTFTITVNPTPTVTDPADQTKCNGAATDAITFSGAVTGTTFNWTNNTTSIGLAASGSGNIASFNAVNTGTTPVVATITVTPVKDGCTGTAQTFTITVNPTATVTDPADQTKCNGAATDAITFSGAVTGTTFNWTNNTTSIGLAASGSGNIASFNAVNTGTTPVVATITVTPVKDGCTGTAQTFTITVNPTPTVNDPADQTKCNGAATDAITFSGAVTGTTFNWTNNTTSIGLAASGSGNIASFNAVNTGTTPVVATITVTPVKDGCTGTAQTFTITVNPTPTVTDPADQTKCNGAATDAITFSGAVTGTTFNWTNNTTSIGLAASGSGNIASFNAVNTGTTPVVATITVTPVKDGCTGTAQTFTITVNPTPTVTDPADQTKCNGAATNAITFSGAVAGTTFNWTNNTTSIGLAASGSGNIASFNAVNNGSSPVVATITVTPVKDGCTGTAQTFTITVNPTPPAPAVTYNAPACDVATFSVTVGSAANPVIAGASYTIVDKNGNAIAGVSPASPHIATASEATNGFSFSNIPAGSGFKVSVSNLSCGSGNDPCGTPSALRLRTTEVVEATIQPQTPTRVLAAPNPFNDRIRFSLQSAVSGQGSLELYNMLGQKVKVVYQGYIQKGVTRTFEYNVPGSQRANLIYVFRVGDERVTGKLIGIR